MLRTDSQEPENRVLAELEDSGPLNVHQEQFCLLYATPDESGKVRRAWECYREVYSTSCKTDETAMANSSRLMADPRVKTRIAQIRADIQHDYIEGRIPFALLAKKILEGLDAMMVKTATDGGKITHTRKFPDYSTRYRYIELALKLRGDMPSESMDITVGGGAGLAHMIAEIAVGTAARKVLAEEEPEQV